MHSHCFYISLSHTHHRRPSYINQSSTTIDRRLPPAPAPMPRVPASRTPARVHTHIMTTRTASPHRDMSCLTLPHLSSADRSVNRINKPKKHKQTETETGNRAGSKDGDRTACSLAGSNRRRSTQPQLSSLSPVWDLPFRTFDRRNSYVENAKACPGPHSSFVIMIIWSSRINHLIFFKRSPTTTISSCTHRFRTQFRPSMAPTRHKAIGRRRLYAAGSSGCVACHSILLRSYNL